ncbi:SDR family oxidoreductase [Nitratireductor sp. GISD-1A_MAKvit]|uniref:SDR family oxidoreductase n=1 Tax=Nitratireductor sp. GISD-1A_MAKvit TaxID=3234198 RepID=UPI0034673494
MQERPGYTAGMHPRPDHGEESYRGSGRLAGRTALITGGDSGIGRAVAIAYAREGADVAIAYLDETDEAQETARWVEEAGRQALLLPGDIGDEAHCQKLIDETVERFGRLDILINNAAYQSSFDKLEEITTETLQRTLATNIFGMFHLCKAALPHLKEGSSIINTSSINATDPSPSLLIYAMTKGAISNFTAGLSGMIAKDGVRVNAVAPGPIWTPLIPSTLPQKKVENFGANTPMGRPGQPAELAGAFVWLASDEASYTTGAVIEVTGGRTML